MPGPLCPNGDPRCSPKAEMSKKISSSRWLFKLCSVNLDTDHYHGLVKKTKLLRFATWQVECTEKFYVQGYMELFKTVALTRMCYLYPGFFFQSAVGLAQRDCISDLAGATDIVQGPWEIGVRAHAERITRSVVIKEVPVEEEELTLTCKPVFKWSTPGELVCTEELSTEEDVVDEGSAIEVRSVPLIAPEAKRVKTAVNNVVHSGLNYLYDMAEVDKCYLDALKFTH